MLRHCYESGRKSEYASLWPHGAGDKALITRRRLCEPLPLRWSKTFGATARQPDETNVFALNGSPTTE
jgi:hypothetical protein